MVLGAAGAWGCSASPGQRVVWDRAALRGETFTVHSPGLVLGSPGRVTAAEAEAGLPWWRTRNNARLNAGGSRGRGEFINYAVQIEDRQRSHFGHIHNTYSRTFHSTRHGQVVR